MKIINTNIENLDANKKLLYKLTKSAGLNVKDCNHGDIFSVKDWVVYEEVGAKGGVNEVLAITTDEGPKLATISPTFKKEFLEIADLMGDEYTYQIVVIKSTSKGGRDFVTCELVCD